MENFFYVDESKFNINQTKAVVVYWDRKPTKKEIEAGIYKKHAIIRLFYNFTTGEYVNITNDNYNDYKIVASKKEVTGITHEYDDTNNCLISHICSFDARRPSYEGEKRSWVITDTYFLYSDKTLYEKPFFKEGDSLQPVNELGEKLYSKSTFSTFPNYSYYMSINSNTNVEDDTDIYLYNILSKMFCKYFRVGNDNIYLMKNNIALSRFLELKETVKKEGKVQREIDDLTKIALPDVKIPRRRSKDTLFSTQKYAFIQKVDENTCCIRMYINIIDNEIKFNEDIELYRMYVKNSKIISCRNNNYGEFIPIKGSLDDFKLDFKLIKFSEKDIKGTTLEYLAKILPDFDKSKHSMILWNFLKNPILEKLYNAGFKEFIMRCIENEFLTHNLNTEIERIFGKLLKDNSFNSCIGFNKYQFGKIKKVENFDYYFSTKYDYKNRTNPGLMNIIKVIAGRNSLQDIDNSTFDSILDLALKLQNKMKESNKYEIRFNIRKLMDISLTISTRYSLNMMLNIAPKLIDSTDALSPYNALYLYSDYLGLVKLINESSDVPHNLKITFKTVDEIKEMHDTAVVVYNLIGVNFRREAFNKVCSKWDKYLYEDDNYAVIAPKEPADLAVEGLELHHCVKSYIDRVIDEKTNIVFIRKKSEINKPFFTVEISNGGIIQQIHGFSNRNLDTEPELIYFVEDWVKKLDLKLGNHKQIR